MAKKNQIKKVKEQFVSVLEDTKIIKVNCKFCQSEFREEAEEKFEETNNIRKVRVFLENKGDIISYLSIRNHLQKHYLGSKRLENVKEWVDDLKNYSDPKYDRKINLYGRIAALKREFVLIASETDDLPMEDRRKSADMLKKLSDGMSTLEDKIEEIENELSPVEVLIENLQELFARSIKRTQSEEAKRILMDMLNELSDIMAGTSVDEK